MTITVYDIGDKPTVTATFTSIAGALTDPSTVVFETRDPAGTEVVYTSPNANIVNSSVGVWAFTFPAAFTLAGFHFVRAKGTAGLITAGEYTLQVTPSKFVTP